MALFNYSSAVSCYRTQDITKYRPQLFGQAARLFQLARECIPPDPVDDHFIIWEGSFSITDKYRDETSAKIVIFERNVGHWQGQDPGWDDGVYVWVRANDRSGREFEKAARQSDFKHGWVLDRFMPNRAVSVAPNPLEHFYYFRIDSGEDLTQIAQLLTFCSAL